MKQAISDLRTTTAENWWERHERAVQRAVDDIVADVKRLAGTRAVQAPAGTEARERVGQPAADTAAHPFTTRRDRFVADLEARIERWEAALERVNARGARKVEVDDLTSRIDKLDSDVDRLKTADADDWWDVTKERVTEYVDRVEESVARLDDDAAGRPRDAREPARSRR